MTTAPSSTNRAAHLLLISEVYATTEIVLAEPEGQRFLHTFDPETGYPELDIQPGAA